MVDASRPRILLLNEFGSLNGGERSLLANIELLKSQFDFLAAVPAESDFSLALDRLEISTLPLTMPASTDSPPGTADLSGQIDRYLLSLVAATQASLVHANSLNMSRHLGRIANRITIPSVGHCRDTFRMSSKAVADLNRLTRMIFVSRAAMDFHVNQKFEVEKGCVFHNGADLEEFAPRAASGAVHRELELPGSARILLSVGQIGMRKGLDFLLDSFELICNANSEAYLLIVGQRYSQKDEAVEYERELRSRARADPLKGRIRFLGLRNDVPALMDEADLLVHAARQEPLGRVLLEACASGLPAVTTDVGGTREIYPTDSSGAILVNKNDVQGFANSVLRLLADSEMHAEQKIAARSRAESAFDRHDSAAKVERLYRRLLNL